MRTHPQIDRRSLAMAEAIVERIDGDPARGGLVRARATCQRWVNERPQPDILEWQAILQGPWEAIRAILLDPSERGRRLRQSDPFCGVLSPRERWRLYREHRETD